MAKSPQRISSRLKTAGSGRRFIDLSPEEREILIQLSDSTAWKVYREVLFATRDDVLFSLLAEPNERKYSKLVGKAEGLHLAAATLDLLVQKIKEARRVPAESKKQGQP